MYWFGIWLLCLLLLHSLKAYPVDKSHDFQSPIDLSDPADYPDLTNGLSNAEIEATLNDLSLDDLSSLDKLLDENGNALTDADASQGAKHNRETKTQERAQNFDFEINSVEEDEALDNNCRDEEDDSKDKESLKCTAEPKCTKKSTTCSTTTTTCSPITSFRSTTCSTTCATTEKGTTKCNGDSASKSKYGGFLDDDFGLDISKCGEKTKTKKCKKNKPKCEDVCDVNDADCLQRNLDRLKQQKTNFQDYEMEDGASVDSNSPLEYDLGEMQVSGMEEQPADESIDNPLKPKKDLNNWNDGNMFNKGYNKPTNMDANWDSNDYKVAPKMSQTWSHSNEEPEEEQPSIQKPYQEPSLERERKDAKVDPEKILTKEDKQEEDSPSDEQPQQQQQEQQENNDEHEQQIIDGDSFIARNARDPPRYLIQAESGDYFGSDNEPADQRLHEEKEQNQSLKFEVDRTDEGEEQSQFKRSKRENKKLDDSPENGGESYLKKLMDSFPRDQGSQSNVNIALKEVEERPHLRVKRS